MCVLSGSVTAAHIVNLDIDSFGLDIFFSEYLTFFNLGGLCAYDYRAFRRLSVSVLDTQSYQSSHLT